jgi:cellulose synthase/poly-beta-1,6-N-acetylglucosamine synthase-like glycosyltransferase
MDKGHSRPGRRRARFRDPRTDVEAGPIAEAESRKHANAETASAGAELASADRHPLAELERQITTFELTPAEVPVGDEPGFTALEPPEDVGLEPAVFFKPEFIAPIPRSPDERPEPAEMRLYDYERYSVLAGEPEEPSGAEVTVRYRRPTGARPRRQLAGAILVIAIQVGFLAWLGLPGHFPHLSSRPWLAVASILMVGSVYAIELFRFINVASLCIASTLARDPVPIPPQAGTHVAFLTTIVPSREPVDVVRKTLQAARRIRHSGTLDVWLLDEEASPIVRSMCNELGVQYFTRYGIERYNQPGGEFKTRSKHGNYNAWIDAHGDEYEFFVSVDPDHVPQPNFCERLLGYFRDPGVAFVVGPQVYGNYDNFVTRGAESQQFVFHGLIQRMGNYFGCPMLVGTNNAVRISALRAIGGLRDSITEDLATSLSFHAASGPRDGHNWRSVYTPDVLAVGEGPSNFTDFFAQQHRWCRGTFENFRGHFWRTLPKLRWGQRLHYTLITSYYPTAAIAWVLGAANCVAYLIWGFKGVIVSPRVWSAVYVDLAFVQFMLYASSRRYNVSPHEAPGSSGAVGMCMSVMAAPIYVIALLQSALGLASNFKITPKGDLKSRDSLWTFRFHLGWAALLGVALAVSAGLSRPEATMRVWSVMLIVVCFAPPLIALLERRRVRTLEHPVRTVDHPAAVRRPHFAHAGAAEARFGRAGAGESSAAVSVSP